MLQLLLYSGIVLIAVPVILMIGFATYIFFAFMRDDETTGGIIRVAFMIMGLGALLVLGYLINTWVAK